MTSPNVSQVPVPFRWSIRDGLNGQKLLARSYNTEIAAALAHTSTKWVSDKNGLLVPQVYAVPPVAVFNGELALHMEPAATNLFLHSRAFDNPAWLKNATGAASIPVVTPNAGVAPDGTMMAARVQLATNGSTTADRSILRQLVTVTAASHAMSFWVKSYTSSTYTILFHVEGSPAAAFTVTPTWSRVSRVQALAAASSNMGMEIRGATLGSSETADFLLWQGQLEVGSNRSSGIQTTTVAVTRAAESVYFDVPGLNPPRAMTLYLRGIDQGISGVANARLLEISNGPARIIMRESSGMNIYHETTSAVQSTASGAPTVGDTLEMLGVLAASGAVTARKRINGAAETVGVTSAPLALAGAWGQVRFYFNGTMSVPPFAYTHVVIADGEQSMDTMRELAGV